MQATTHWLWHREVKIVDEKGYLSINKHSVLSLAVAVQRGSTF
jgi:hypothetical protein